MKDITKIIIELKLPALLVRNLIWEADIKTEQLKREYANKSDAIYKEIIKYWESASELMEGQLQKQLKNIIK